MSIVRCGACGEDISDWVVNHQGDANCPHCRAPFQLWRVKATKITERLKGGLAFFVLFFVVFFGLASIFIADPVKAAGVAAVASSLALAAIVVWAETRPRNGDEA